MTRKEHAQTYLDFRDNGNSIGIYIFDLGYVAGLLASGFGNIGYGL